MKKKIGVSFTTTNNQNYLNWFTPEDLGDDIELLQLSFEENNEQDISLCSGFILTGGIDIDADLYDGEPDYEHKPELFHTDRDHFEKKIYDFAQQHHLPVLGICRGLQLVNVLEGGKLVQDLGPENEVHKKAGEEDKQHLVHIQRDSLLFEISGVSEGMVNSAHHQAIDQREIAPTLKINALSGTNDRTIEGIEFKDQTGKPFMLCVQWHPERMKDKEESPLSKNIKQSFLNAIRQQK
ncbi:gamma-glutamyl-gamma-aminobutyrate hydrolase family protein [Flavihumibacter profundi]|uniref:gamma-glutamyl-gamma-aminobutyrate hydrolase family protein n=1 Tax=Flavihumibacter profundi TaxID=2716883 RepID=UPI001CC4BDCB|nr:gamma-glutamyl-gamma-aminobutyrate hydrolase family protein [Flavihumibacter profundi]MBZ5859293.1 gamma-glutamyl-gamma-aminobutyrate hydrolase family protein [Flavihumibacter profundi]